MRVLLLSAILLTDVHVAGSLLARELLVEQRPDAVKAAAPTEWQARWLLRPLTTIRSVVSPATPDQRRVAAAFWGLHIVAGLAFAYFYSTRRRSPDRPGEASRYGSHGTARWATPRELYQHLRISGPGLILGKLNGRYLIHPPDFRHPHNQLVAVFGGSGARKTRSWVIPNILHETAQPPDQRSSLVIVDPKAENYALTADLLRRRGYRVHILNLLDPGHSDRWNPLDYVHTPLDAADLAHNLVANTANPNRPRSGDPFWDSAEQSLITALVLYVKRHRPVAEQHLASVLELGTDPCPEDLDAIFLALPRDDPARKFYRTFLRAEEKVRAGVLPGLGSRLQLWNSAEFAALTAASDFKLDDLARSDGPTALYLLIPDAKGTYAPVLALFWQQVFQVLYDLADRHGGTLPRRVRCRMDEFANCGYIPEIEKKLSTMRSRGISVELILQALSQLKNRYPATWSEMLANCDTWLFLGCNDLETAQYISQKLGTGTIRVHSEGHSDSDRSSSHSGNISPTGRPLLTPDECLRLDPDEALLLRKGCHPARVRKTDYTEHVLARELSLADHRWYRVPERGQLLVTDPSVLPMRLPGTPGYGPTGPGPAFGPLNVESDPWAEPAGTRGRHSGPDSDPLDLLNDGASSGTDFVDSDSGPVSSDTGR